MQFTADPIHRLPARAAARPRPLLPHLVNDPAHALIPLDPLVFFAELHPLYPHAIQSHLPLVSYLQRIHFLYDIYCLESNDQCAFQVDREKCLAGLRAEGRFLRPTQLSNYRVETRMRKSVIMSPVLVVLTQFFCRTPMAHRREFLLSFFPSTLNN